MRRFPLLVVMLIAATVSSSVRAAGTTRYVDPIAGACTGNYSLEKRDCTGSDGNSYATIALGSAATTAGDTLLARGGTYVEALNNALSAGVSPTVPTVFRPYGNETVIIAPGTGIHVIVVSGRSNITIQDIHVDGTGMTGSGVKVDAGSHNFILEGTDSGRCSISSTTGTGFSSQGVSNNGIVRGCEIVDDGLLQTASPYAHGIYIQNGSGWLIERNKIHDNGCLGIQIYPNATNSTVRFNKIYDNGRTEGCGTQVVLSNAGHLFEHNEVRNIVEVGNTYGVRVQYGSPNGTTIRHNTFYNAGTNGIYVHSDASNIKIENNIVLDSTTPINNLGTGTTLTTNLTAGIAADVFNLPNLTLPAGSPAIDAGTNIGLPKCGSAPDQGAYEVCGFISATITGNTLDVTMESIYPPLQVFGPSGWSVTCTPNPDSCGTPTVVSTTLAGGSGSIARSTIAGIFNTNCTAGQIWTVSFDGSSFGLSDYMVLGLQTNQFAHSFTARAVTNNCTGGGPPPPPAGAYIYYPMDGNANDSSGGNRHATTSGVAFTTGKYGQGMRTDAGQPDYAELPYLNGINPSTQSLTVAFGVHVAASDMGVTRDVFGTPLGTNQRFYIFRSSSNNWRMGTQSNAGAVTEFTVSSGWNFVCVTFNSATDTATLSINGVTGAASGSSVQTYTSYTFAGNGRIGLPSGFADTLNGQHIFDEFRLYQSVVSCTDLYNAWNPPTSSWTGTLSLSAARVYGAKVDWLGALMPLAALNTTASVAPAGIFTYAGQVDCSVADCSAISYKLYYSCAACPSAGTELPLPNTATADEVEFYGSAIEQGILAGPHGANLSGALAHVNGETVLLANATNGPDLAQNNSTVHRFLGRFTAAAVIGRQYCFKMKEQSGLALNGYTPSGGLCVTVGPPSASAGF